MMPIYYLLRLHGRLAIPTQIIRCGENDEQYLVELRRPYEDSELLKL